MREKKCPNNQTKKDFMLFWFEVMKKHFEKYLNKILSYIIEFFRSLNSLSETKSGCWIQNDFSIRLFEAKICDINSN